MVSIEELTKNRKAGAKATIESNKHTRMSQILDYYNCSEQELKAVLCFAVVELAIREQLGFLRKEGLL